MSEIKTVSDYLIQQLWSRGVRHVFGVPGDYALKFYNELEKSKLQIINTADAQGAGYAADAYARVNGLGAVCVTYGVGGLVIANTTAQAFAEKSPVLIISGVPSAEEQMKNLMYHHKIGEDFKTQWNVFKELTIAQAILDNPRTAAREIDRVLEAAVFHKQPVYIEFPSDMATAPYIPSTDKTEKPAIHHDKAAMKEAVSEAVQMINSAQKPVIIAGVELHRFGLQNTFRQWLEETGIPYTTMLLGKSVLSEDHPRYIGLYIGAFSKEEIREYVESSDCLILLGAFHCELNLGAFTAKLNRKCMIDAGIQKISIGYHTYDDVRLDDFLKSMLDAKIKKRTVKNSPHPEKPGVFKPGNGPITVKRLFEGLNAFTDDKTVVIADPGNSLFVGADMHISGQSQFLAAAYYLSLGYAVPGCIGVQLAKPELRPLVLVGDGAFLMTGMECATAVRYKLTPVIVIFNNKGYSSERRIIDGSYNDIPILNYSVMGELIGHGREFEIRTEAELDSALQYARQNTVSLCILDVHLDPQDIAPILQRVAGTLSKKRQDSEE